ncbi:response regulator [Patescibacteria group bacterium]|nr:response regulator [Patescibacteria group bacterium]
MNKQEKNKAKIALIEDDKFLLGAMNDKLLREGFSVFTAVNGEGAMELIKKEKPDLILLDLIMPVKSGFEVLEDLKNDNELKNIPVIILSNLGQESDIEKGKELGAVDYLIKADFKMKEVIEKIKGHLP